MPNMASITIKKVDGSTDFVFEAATPASGDTTSAVWLGVTGASANAFRPRFEVKTRWNAQKTKRRVDFLLNAPITQTSDGVTTIADYVTVTGTATLPQTQSAVDVQQDADYFGKLLSSALMQAVFLSGFAPN